MERFLEELQRFVELGAVLMEAAKIDERRADPFLVADFTIESERLGIVGQGFGGLAERVVDRRELAKGQSNAALIISTALDLQRLTIVLERLVRPVQCHKHITE